MFETFAGNFLRRVDPEFARAGDFARDVVEHVGRAFGEDAVALRIGVGAKAQAATPDEVKAVGAFLMGFDGAFITESDFIMDGGVTAAYWFGELSPK